MHVYSTIAKYFLKTKCSAGAELERSWSGAGAELERSWSGSGAGAELQLASSIQLLPRFFKKFVAPQKLRMELERSGAGPQLKLPAPKHWCRSRNSSTHTCRKLLKIAALYFKISLFDRQHAQNRLKESVKVKECFE